MAMKSFLKYIIIFCGSVYGMCKQMLNHLSFVICLFQMDFRIWWLM